MSRILSGLLGASFVIAGLGFILVWASVSPDIPDVGTLFIQAVWGYEEVTARILNMMSGIAMISQFVGLGKWFFN